MNFLSIEYFLIIVEEGSISAAARRLLVSQQSLSEHVKKLENEIGAKLLKRAHNVSLTPAGERFAAGVRDILNTRNEMLRDIAAITEQEQQRLTIGIATFEAPVFLAELLTEFNQRYPQYETTVVKRRPRDITHNMKGMDLYFSFLPLSDKLEHIPIIQNDCYCVCGRQSLFKETYGERWPVIQQELIDSGELSVIKDLPFLILQDRQGMISQDQETVFSSAGFEPVIGFQSDSGDLNSSMCIRGKGANIIPFDLAVRKYSEYMSDKDNPLLAFLLSTPDLPVCMAISYQKGKILSLAEKRFIETAKSVLSSDPSSS